MEDFFMENMGDFHLGKTYKKIVKNTTRWTHNNLIKIIIDNNSTFLNALLLKIKFFKEKQPNLDFFLDYRNHMKNLINGSITTVPDFWCEYNIIGKNTVDYEMEIKAVDQYIKTYYSD